MALTSLSTKGQIIIPKRIREALGLRPGAKFIIELEGNRVILRPVKENVANRLYGRYKGLGLLKDLAREHRGEVERNAEREQNFAS